MRIHSACPPPCHPSTGDIRQKRDRRKPRHKVPTYIHPRVISESLARKYRQNGRRQARYRRASRRKVTPGRPTDRQQERDRRKPGQKVTTERRISNHVQRKPRQKVELNTDRSTSNHGQRNPRRQATIEKPKLRTTPPFPSSSPHFLALRFPFSASPPLVSES